MPRFALEHEKPDPPRPAPDSCRQLPDRLLGEWAEAG